MGVVFAPQGMLSILTIPPALMQIAGHPIMLLLRSVGGDFEPGVVPAAMVSMVS